ncbi:hypothetical protein AA0115_g8675 [Alternaria tenuissima]|uniref:Uncharacterized protein n=1 Tax=Alternaria tenuissima TaxID=119927 RepID=A0AB37WA48_9PLEO|nr:hypothetical protein AA0115_g8675 [Alternaria tenuissima]
MSTRLWRHWNAGLTMRKSRSLLLMRWIRAANARREEVDAKLTVATRAPLKDAEHAEDAEIAQAAFKGAKRRPPGSEPQEESVGVEFSALRPAKKVKKDFARALGIKRKDNI